MAGIIKTGSSRKPADDAEGVAFNFEDMSQKANSYLDSVRQQAIQIITQARQQAEKIRQEAQAAGLQAAREAAQKAAEAQVQQQLDSLLPVLQEAIARIDQTRHDWQQRWEHYAVQLATQIAARIVRRELEHTPEITLDLVREALELATCCESMRLYLNPRDHALLAGQVQQLSRQLGQLGPAEIIADADIERGGCRLETQFGEIDQQIQTQLARIEAELT